MIFVDTGYLLAILNPRDELFERAQRWAAFVDEPLITTEYIVWEMVNSLSAPADRAKAHAAVAETNVSHDQFFESIAIDRQNSLEKRAYWQRFVGKQPKAPEHVAFTVKDFYTVDLVFEASL
jgi:predicted nucleic acid-binding protein